MTAYMNVVRHVAICALLLSISVSSYAQKLQREKIWCSPDGSISLKVPFAMSLGKDWGESQSPRAESEPGYDSIIQFGATSEDLTFILYILKPNKLTQKEPLEEKLGGLEFTIGGDDDHDFAETWGTFAGHPSRKIVYRKQNNIGFMIDAGERIFVLGVNADSRKDLDLPAVKKFFAPKLGCAFARD